MTGFTYVAGDARRFSGFGPISTPHPVRWNHVSSHALTVLGIAPPELYINPLVLHHFMYFRQLLMQLIRPSIDLFSHINPF